MDPSPLQPTGFDAAFSAVFAIVAVLILVGIVSSVVVAVRRRTVLRDAGLDPLTADAQVLAQMHHRLDLAPDRSVERSAESRLAEAVDLHQRGLITADELGEMRQRILGEV